MLKINHCCFNIKEYSKACWIIEEECNLNCPYCFQHSFGNDIFLHNESAEQVISKLQKKEIKYVVLTGGEPLLCKNLFQIIAQLQEARIDIGICTNAILADEEFCANLSKTLVRNITVNMSLIDIDGNDDKSNRSIQGINNLINKKFKVTLNDVLLDKWDYTSIQKRVEWAKNIGVKQYSLTVPVCKYPEYPECYIDPDKIIGITEILKKMDKKMDNSKKMGTFEVVFNIPDCMQDGCPSEEKIFGISDSGEIEMCLIKKYQRK